LLFDDVEELEFIGPIEVFGTAARLGASLSLTTISDHSPVLCRLGTRVEVQQKIHRAGRQDVLIVPGGPGAEAVKTNAAFLRYLRMPHGIIAPVCTGSVLLEAAGISNQYARFIDDCSGSGAPSSAGIDVALALVEQICSAQIANAVASIVQRQRPQRRLACSAVRGLF